ncbi:hypothetical protein A3J15_01605 [Candidatus Roizmanbacteria bacterium RIFCSPLOWO2_02_FULL_38_10]|uniref:CoA transferase n=1 Tax=Candidatus Roizmanbacteria bacterium RIFCSPLOWO2_02_FULL_38_10 TaxID=1802074 RepID=A0A1F7JN06_9BACT|nr:MAG: hypothetical protein A3J15_01605 [Candidatus Roizmanbacteria bacterium RIFCSPLOWO2_02_FULL_38_10]
MGNKKIIIIEFASLLPGPFATYLLDKQLFEINKIEDVRNPDQLKHLKPTQNGVSVVYNEINRNKKNIQVDFRSDTGAKKITDLVKQADILVENHKPGRMNKLGFGYQDCLKINPKLIYISVTGFGQKHPLSQFPAHDLNILGLSGYLLFNNNSLIPPLPLADIFSSYHCALSILSALIGNRPQYIDLSMLDIFIKSSTLITTIMKHRQGPLEQDDFILWGSYPCYHIYKTQDKRLMVLSAIEPMFWSDFCNEINRVDLIGRSLDPNACAEIESIISAKPQKYWIEKKINSFTPVLSYLESQKLGYVK